MSENRNEVPGEPAKDPQAQPWEQPSGNTADADAPTQPLYGRYAPDADQEATQDAAQDAVQGSSQEASFSNGPAQGPDAAQAGSGQPAPAYSSSQGPWSQPQQSPGQSYGQPQQPGYGSAPNSGYGAAPSPYGYPGGYAPAPAAQPGKTMGIIGLILSCLFFIPFASLVGVILSIVAFVQSRKAKLSNGPALAGIIIGAVVFVLTTLATIAIFFFAVDAASTIYDVCTEPGAGVVFVDGEQVDCSDFVEFEQTL